MTAERAKRRRTIALRAIVSIGLAAVLAWKIPIKGVAHALENVSALGIALSLAVIAIQVVVGAQRWRRMLARTGVRAPLGVLVADILVGSAYHLVLPSSVGGDFVRAYRCASRLEEPAHGWSTTLFERIVGIPALALVAVPGIVLVPGGRSLLLPTLAIAAGGVVVLLVADFPLRFASKLLATRAPSFAKIGEGVAADLRGPLGKPAARAEAFAWSLLYQVLGISLLAACVAPTADERVIVAIYAGVPVIAVGSMLPITIAGLGLRETLFVVVLGRLGVDSETALALGLLWLASYFVVAVAGVVVSMRGGACDLRMPSERDAP